ncbi:MAG: hypothetical protein AAF527_08020 [Pseudomonadota bacterium]
MPTSKSLLTDDLAHWAGLSAPRAAAGGATHECPELSEAVDRAQSTALAQRDAGHQTRDLQAMCAFSPDRR